MASADYFTIFVPHCVLLVDVWFIAAYLSRHTPEFIYAFMHMRTLQKPADQCKSMSTTGQVWEYGFRKHRIMDLYC